MIFDEPVVLGGGERLFASDHSGVLVEVQFLPEDQGAPNPPGAGA